MRKHKGNLPHKHFGVTDLDTMDSKWRIEFEREVAANNFVRGGRSLVLLGEGAVEAHEHWLACLLLAGMDAVITDPVEILRRLRGQYIPRDTEQTKEDFDTAETVFIRNFFGVSEDVFSQEDRDLLAWYFDQAVQDGVSIIIATDNDEDTTGLYQVIELAAIIDKNFEAIHVTNTGKTKK